MNVRHRRILTYLGLFVALFLGYVVLRDAAWRSSTQLHTLMEAIATFLALFVGVIALVRFYTKKINIFLFIGTGFLGTGLLDGYHALVTSSFFAEKFPSAPSSLIPWSWTASRVFLSVSLWLSWLGWKRESRQGEPGRIGEHTVYLTAGALTLASFLFFAFVPLPRAYYPELFFHRPEDLLPGFFFLLALVGYWRKGHWKFEYFEYWLVLSLIVGFLGQVQFMSFSGQLFDPMFDTAHLLKNFSYVFVLTGLLMNTYQLFRRAEESSQEIEATNKALQMEIAEHRRAEQEIRALARFPDENPSPILRVARNGTVLYANKGSVPLLRNSKGHAAKVVPDSWRSVIVEVSTSGSSKAIDVTCGELVYDLNFVPVVEAEYVNIYGTDITERKRAQGLLEEYSRTLEQKVEERTRDLREKQTQLIQSEKMAALGNLVAGVAHEINTPLGAMYSNNDIVARSVSKMKGILHSWENSDKEQQYSKLLQLVHGIEAIGEVNRAAAERIVNIVASLKSFARLDRAIEDQLDIHEGLESTLTLVHHQLKNRITVHKEYGQLPLIRCYPNQLNQVYMNILVNAIQAIEGTGRISIRTYTRNNLAVVEISDTGGGIPSEKLNRIFDPGFTTKGVKVGTGLGLSIVHRIIQDHNGAIEVESELGKGSTFRIILPIR